MAYPIESISLPNTTEKMVELKSSSDLIRRIEMALVAVSNVVITNAKTNTFTETETTVDGKTIVVKTPGVGNVPNEVIALAKECSNSEARRQENAKKILSLGVAKGVIASESVEDSVIINLILSVINDIDFLKVVL